MREILYRGKAINRDPNKQYRMNLKNGDWVFGLLSKLDEYGAEMTNEVGVSRIDVDPNSIGQFTGLADKNGNKIFEGDIVMATTFSSKWVGVIIWIDEIASFGVRYRHRETPTSWEKSSMLKRVSAKLSDEFTAEIIGNIQDNPELLENL